MNVKINGSVYNNAHGLSLFEQWPGEILDLRRYPMLPLWHTYLSANSQLVVSGLK